MQLKTILNAVEKHKLFVFGEARWSKNKKAREIEFDVQPRKNSRPVCSGCNKQRPGYDRLAARRFEYVPLWAVTTVHKGDLYAPSSTMINLRERISERDCVLTSLIQPGEIQNAVVDRDTAPLMIAFALRG